MRDRTLYHLLVSVGSEIAEQKNDPGLQKIFKEVIETMSITFSDSTYALNFVLRGESRQLLIDGQRFRFHVRNDSLLYIERNSRYLNLSILNREQADLVWSEILDLKVKSTPRPIEDDRDRTPRQIRHVAVIWWLIVGVVQLLVFGATGELGLAVVFMIVAVVFSVDQMFRHWAPIVLLVLLGVGLYIVFPPDSIPSLAVLGLTSVWCFLGRGKSLRLQYGILTVSMIWVSALIPGFSFFAIPILLLALSIYYFVELQSYRRLDLVILCFGLAYHLWLIFTNEYDVSIEVSWKVAATTTLSLLVIAVFILNGVTPSALNWLLVLAISATAISNPHVFSTAVISLSSMLCLAWAKRDTGNHSFISGTSDTSSGVAVDVRTRKR
jgi:hypothetical protein